MSFNVVEGRARLNALAAIVKASAKITLAGYSSSPGIRPTHLLSNEKSSFKDLVTEYDVKVEEFFIQELSKAFPGERVVGEEGAYAKGMSHLTHESFTEELVWVLDPIDGTTNYSRSYPYFCTTACLLAREAGKYRPVVGVTLDPVRNEIYCAAEGAGAFMNDELIRVSAIDRLEHALFVTGFSERRAQRDLSFERFMALTRKSLGVRRSGAAALDLAYVAIGRLDAYWESGLNAWDVAAGALLVREAQGSVSHYEQADEWSPWSGEILASNGPIHATLHSALGL